MTKASVGGFEFYFVCLCECKACVLLISKCTKEESVGKCKGEDQRFCLGEIDQRFCFGEIDQKIGGRLGSPRRLVRCLVSNPLFFSYNTSTNMGLEKINLGI